MFEQVKQEPATIEEKKDEEDIVVTDYLQHSMKNNAYKTDAYYCTKLGQVKGMLLILDDVMLFEAVQCQENEYLVIC